MEQQAQNFPLNWGRRFGVFWQGVLLKGKILERLSKELVGVLGEETHLQSESPNQICSEFSSFSPSWLCHQLSSQPLSRSPQGLSLIFTPSIVSHTTFVLWRILRLLGILLFYADSLLQDGISHEGKCKDYDKIRVQCCCILTLVSLFLGITKSICCHYDRSISIRRRCCQSRDRLRGYY